MIVSTGTEWPAGDVCMYYLSNHEGLGRREKSSQLTVPSLYIVLTPVTGGS